MYFTGNFEIRSRKNKKWDECIKLTCIFEIEKQVLSILKVKPPNIQINLTAVNQKITHR